MCVKHWVRVANYVTEVLTRYFFTIVLKAVKLFTINRIIYRSDQQRSVQYLKNVVKNAILLSCRVGVAMKCICFSHFYFFNSLAKRVKLARIKSFLVCMVGTIVRKNQTIT